MSSELDPRIVVCVAFLIVYEAIMYDFFENSLQQPYRNQLFAQMNTEQVV